MNSLKYKMLFTDIDGTLLNRERVISAKTKNQIERISKEHQIPVILISSRMPKAMNHLQNELGTNYPIISYNGALIIETANENVIHSETIPFHIVQEIFEKSKIEAVHTSLYCYDNWYVEELDFWASREINNTKAEPEVIKFETLFSTAPLENLNMHKIMCMGDKAGIDDVLKHASDNFGNELNLYRSKDTYLEITSNKASKATAVKKIHQNYNIKADEIIAVGDNYNDLEMLEYAGLGVAMGNAKDEIKKIADEITLSNTEDGVAELIKKYF